jgi:hypothetical protein
VDVFSDDLNWVIWKRLFPNPTEKDDGAYAEGGEGGCCKSSHTHVTRNNTSTTTEGIVPLSEGSPRRSTKSSVNAECTSDVATREPYCDECRSIRNGGRANGANDGSRPAVGKPGTPPGLSFIPHAFVFGCITLDSELPHVLSIDFSLSCRVHFMHVQPIKMTLAVIYFGNS